LVKSLMILNMSLFRIPLLLLKLFLKVSAPQFDTEFGSGKYDYGNNTERKGYRVVSDNGGS